MMLDSSDLGGPEAGILQNRKGEMTKIGTYLSNTLEQML
jgi:hypothetical protein